MWQIYAQYYIIYFVIVCTLYTSINVFQCTENMQIMDIQMYKHVQ